MDTHEQGFFTEENSVEVVTGRGSSEGGGTIRRELPLWLNLPDIRPLILGASHPHAANPGSVRAAIDSLASFDGERVLVLGAMAELGAGSRELHREVGEHARLRGITQLLACGEHAEALAAGFGTGARIFASHQELIAACRGFDRPGCVILVKGSRAAAMERVVDALVHADPGMAGTGRH